MVSLLTVMQNQTEESNVSYVRAAIQSSLKRSHEGTSPTAKKIKLSTKTMKKGVGPANKISKYFLNASSTNRKDVGEKQQIDKNPVQRPESPFSKTKVKLTNNEMITDCGESSTKSLHVQQVVGKTPHNKVNVCNIFNSHISKSKVNLLNETDLANSMLPASGLSAIPNLKWKNIRGQDLNVDYTILFSRRDADEIFQKLEKEVEYYTGDYTKLKVFGKWHEIPRKQVAYGDTGLTYAFSGNCLPAKKWTPLLTTIREAVEKVSNNSYNFVLINRYKDGNDHIGEHRDDEKELLPGAPIASLSFGQERDFVFRHASLRLKSAPNPPSPVTVALEHGSLLLMKIPTNKFWYHSLPVRKRAFRPRINLTFRSFAVK